MPEIEQEADRLMDKLDDKYHSDISFEYKEFVDKGYVPVEFLDWFYDAPNRKTRYRAVRNMKDRGYLKDGEAVRQTIDENRKSCYVMTQKFKERMNLE